ncbi:DUF2062 domain-containing protein [Rhizobium rhizophilum]|uniref:DUF2062 domain-containing protein n=1 Tax=Rhizobium rhizophilum TaxID=1850373 RepID=A0ABY2QUY2_9HYPH|nr:DUF2062 domain-containing protein [Rhizobium rhizophilum]THV14395.1 DUF2062 domain-containing protein [Rhizobium rhizophilum]
MLFRRRQPISYLTKLRELLWPRRGFLRSFQYLSKRILRLSATPHAIAAGVAAGVLSSWTPFIGLHFLLAFAVAYLIAGNMVAAALGTAFGNPVTFPFIWAATWEVGHRLIGKGSPTTQSVDLEKRFSIGAIESMWQPILKPMLIGAIPLAAVSGVIVYCVIYFTVAKFQTRRRERLAERARARLAEALQGSSI